ncbi:glycoside hydrolase family 6 protein [Streptomyces bambusae]|uniref:glycoside hydrolase family 6 protein n=1 Tax=Streptomyces bambusae TaxID=1550616 RepID=UPI001CFD0AA2|nr:glycoside hydrolase family 6 protein [Streptomyces bambusae]MCB5168792.1 glycoside hydrolase family 6 protein [Streptomyces bambusae]
MHHRHLARALLPAAALAAVLLPGVPSVPAVPAVHREAAAPELPLYAPPANPEAHAQARRLRAAGRGREADALTAMAATPHAVWLGDQSPAQAEAEARATTMDAARRQSLPVLVLYNVPGRDCSQYSAGGATGTAAYRDWIDAVARGIDDHRAIVVLEPDSLALLPRECPPGAAGGDELARTRTAARYTEIDYAVRVLESKPATDVYLDTGHATWHTVNNIVPRLRQAGIAHATGFAVNVSNYNTDAANVWFAYLVSVCLAHTEAGGSSADCPDQWRPHPEAQAWIDSRAARALDPARMKHFITDTSRNGLGPWQAPAGRYRDPQDWCNPPGRGLGARPSTRTGYVLHDARLWIKTPGESDGACLRGTRGPLDPERGVQSPKAGDWFPEQALELVRLANPAIMG